MPERSRQNETPPTALIRNLGEKNANSRHGLAGNRT
jgi:hypothetical protein